MEVPIPDMNEYDTLMSDMLAEMTDLFKAGLVSERTGPDFSTEERFIILSRRLSEMATSRADTKAIRREGRMLSMRDKVFTERKAKHEAEKAAKGR